MIEDLVLSDLISPKHVDLPPKKHLGYQLLFLFQSPYRETTPRKTNMSLKKKPCFKEISSSNHQNSGATVSFQGGNIWETPWEMEPFNKHLGKGMAGKVFRRVSL